MKVYINGQGHMTKMAAMYTPENGHIFGLHIFPVPCEACGYVLFTVI